MKRVVIMGGGKLAYYVIESLQDMVVDIALIDLDVEHGMRIANRFENVRVFAGDGTSIAVLEKAGCRDADFYVAVSGSDADNLIGCLVAKKHFQVQTTVARVNNPRNLGMFKRLEVDHVYNATQILTDLIEHNIQYEGMRVVYNVRETPHYMIEVSLSPRSKYVDKRIADIRLPGTTRIALVIRDDKTSVIPTGDTHLKKGDMLLLVAEKKYYDEIYHRCVR